MSASKVKKSKSKTPPDQPVAGPSNDSKDPPNRRGRKLDFPTKRPLEGKKFYLELTGPRHRQQLSKLRAEVEELGGIVEQFLSKDLACVISDRLEAKDVEKISKGVPSGTSPAVSTPSPFHQGRDTTPGAADSPSNAPKDSRIGTRGKAIVQKATKSQMYGTTDVLTNARNWNIPVKHLDVLVKYLCREKEKLKLSGNDKKKSNKEKSGIKAKERQLTKPYLKAEDKSRRFRPISKEFGTWPRILLDTRKGSCPYDPKTRNESNVQGAERTQDRPDASQRTPDIRYKELSRSQSLSKKAVTKAAKQKEATASKNNKAAKKGFCEFCSVKYSNLDKHLETEQHKKFVEEKNNYTSLDTMIAQGPNLVRFLEDCVRFKNVDPQSSSAPDNDTAEDSGTEDEVLLLTEPRTPTKGTQKDTKKVKRKREKSASRRRSLGRSPRKTLKNGTPVEGPVPVDNPQQNPEELVSNRITNENILQDTSKTRSVGRPADKSPEIGDGGGDCPIREKKDSCLEDRLTGGNGDAMNSQQTPNVTSPEISTGQPRFSSPSVSESRKGNSKKRRSGGRRSLSLQLRENRTIPVTPQGVPAEGGVVQEGVVREGQEACTVLRGIAGEEEPIRQEGKEVMITRIRREITLQEIRVEEADKTVESVQQQLGNVVGREGVQENPQMTIAVTASIETPAGRRAKRGSQAITSPGSTKQSRMSKRQRTSTVETESDDVFTSNPTASIIDCHLSLPTNPAVGQDKNPERQKRKSRRSHADAPPQKVRGSSVRVNNNNDAQSLEGHSDTIGSPCIREAQPRVPATHHDDLHSSDDFQQVSTPASGSAKSSGKKKLRKSARKDLKSTSQDSPTIRVEANRKKSLRNQASTGKSSTPESNNSESDFQTANLTNSDSKNKRGDSSSAKKCKESISRSQEETDKNDLAGTDVGESINTVFPSSTSLSQPGEKVANDSQSREQCNAKGRLEPTNDNADSGGDSQRERHVSSQAEQSLELVFRSDLGAEESSFLGFSQEDINETANRSEVFQQQNLDKAALSVYCIPSSDPVPDDDRSSSGSNDFTIGLVLQKVENFPSEGSEWEEQVTGFMKRLDTQLEIKKRRESELSTLPSPNLHKSIFGWQKENQNILSGVVEDFGPEPISDDDEAPVFPEANKNVKSHETDRRSSTRRRSARISDSFNTRPATRSTPAESLSYSGMCTSPSKRTKNVSGSKQGMALGDKPAGTSTPNALRELSPNKLMNSPQKTAETKHYSTPKRIRRNLMNTKQSPSMKHIVLPPGTPAQEQEEIANNYVHDDSESEVVFPKFSSPAQKGSIFSPVKHRVKHNQFRTRHRSVPYLGQRDVQSSPLRPSNRRDLVSFPFTPSSRKSLFMKGRVKRINISSPRKRSKSYSSPPKKSSQFLTFLNELRAGLSPTFYTFKKPHFSLRILQPSAVRRHHCHHKMSRSLLALNLCLPSNAELRIYEFHDDDSVDEDDDLGLSPIKNDSARKELHDQCTQTPPSSRKQLRTRTRRHSEGRSKRGTSQNIKGKVKNVKEVEHDSGRKGKRSVKIQASSPDIDSIFDMPPGYYL